MSEYIIDIDVDKARFSEDGTKIQLVPSALREIVRCRDCRFVKTCDVHNQMCLQYGNESADNGFCAWSERKEK